MEIFNTYNEDKMKYPIIITIPHGGTEIPIEIKERFEKSKAIIANNDWFLKELYDFLIDMDLTILSANYSRYVVDLNRIITEPIIGEDYNKCTIYGKNTWENNLYEKLPTQEECEKRIEEYYNPYHKKLQELIDKKLKKFNRVLIIDLHSGGSSTGDKNICLGNANWEISDRDEIEKLKTALESVGYTVNLNTPFTGGKVLRKYHKEDNRIHCILFELNYNQYIRESYIGEEEIKEYDEELFNNTKNKLKLAFEKFLVQQK